MRFRFEQTIELPRATLFAFYEDPEHLVLLHRGWAKLRVICCDHSLRPGSRTWFELTVAGILPVVMGFEHSVYEPPHRFGERLIHGPFSEFTHVHEFEEVNAGTVVRDLLTVSLPWYYGGNFAMKLVVGPLARRSFKFRAATLLSLAQTGEIAQYLDRRLS